MLVCMKNTAIKDVSWDRHSTWICLALYLSYNIATPCVVFSIHTRGSALKLICINCLHVCSINLAT